jgi:dethiobiotin synthetase
MSGRIIVAGTDTGIGKTVFAAGLAGFLGAAYWKPVQSGLDGETDSAAVERLGGLPPIRILPEAYRLRTPASPHHAAELDGVTIDAEGLSPPPGALPLVIEGAGGVMVPLTRGVTFADLLARWRFPVVLCAKTELGTISHTLSALEALNLRAVPVLGVAFIGDARPDTERTIGEMGRVRVLGRLPEIEPLTPDSLRAAFQQAFRMEDFWV